MTHEAFINDPIFQAALSSLLSGISERDSVLVKKLIELSYMTGEKEGYKHGRNSKYNTKNQALLDQNYANK